MYTVRYGNGMPPSTHFAALALPAFELSEQQAPRLTTSLVDLRSVFPVRLVHPFRGITQRALSLQSSDACMYFICRSVGSLPVESAPLIMQSETTATAVGVGPVGPVFVRLRPIPPYTFFLLPVIRSAR